MRYPALGVHRWLGYPLLGLRLSLWHRVGTRLLHTPTRGLSRSTACASAVRRIGVDFKVKTVTVGRKRVKGEACLRLGAWLLAGRRSTTAKPVAATAWASGAAQPLPDVPARGKLGGHLHRAERHVATRLPSRAQRSPVQ